MVNFYQAQRPKCTPTQVAVDRADRPEGTRPNLPTLATVQGWLGARTARQLNKSLGGNQTMNFDPNENQTNIENYLSKNLGYQVEFIQATRLAKSTREAPWRLIVETNRKTASYVLQLDQDTIEHEYQALKTVEQIPIPTPKAYGLDLSGKEIGVPCFFSDFIEGQSLLAPMLAGELWAEELYLKPEFGITTQRLRPAIGFGRYQ